MKATQYRKRMDNADIWLLALLFYIVLGRSGEVLARLHVANEWVIGKCRCERDKSIMKHRRIVGSVRGRTGPWDGYITVHVTEKKIRDNAKAPRRKELEKEVQKPVAGIRFSHRGFLQRLTCHVPVC